MSEMPNELHIPVWTIGDRLHKSLRDASLGNDEMADYLGVSRNTVGNWIAERTPINKAALRLWAMRCGVPLEWLRDGVVGDPEGGDYAVNQRSEGANWLSVA